MRREEISSHFERYGPMVYRRALLLLHSPSEAQDATQEVFIRALKNAETFSHHSQVSTWLYRITTNYCLNLIRDQKRRAELLEEHAQEPVFPGAPDPTDLLLIRRLLADADERQAQVATYIYLDGMRREEVARVMGISVRTVGNLLARFNTWAKERIES